MRNGIEINQWGHKKYLKDGKLHSLDEPAVEWYDGTKFWYKEGCLHREDGPAIISQGGYKEWWLNGIRFYSKESFWENLSNEAKLRMIFNSIDDLNFP
jgi:hypothetical protein